jgi:hypothetical protein
MAMAEIMDSARAEFKPRAVELLGFPLVLEARRHFRSCGK